MSLLRVSETDMQHLINAGIDSKDECPENFKCVICQCLVYDPQECTACVNMYCKLCIKGWKKEKCPLCQKTLQLQPLNRMVRNLLDVVELKGCPMDGCQEGATQMTYEKLVKHLKSTC